MSFASPYWLLSLLVVPVLAGVMWILRRRRHRYSVAYTNLDVLASVIPPRRWSRSWIPTALVLVSLGCAAFAVARPRIDKTVADRHAVVVMLVDVSGSMQANDVVPTRIQAAVKAMQTFVARLPAQADVGLVEFSSEPATIDLPTTDHATVLDAIGLLSPQGATALGDGIGTAIEDAKIGLSRLHGTQPTKPGAFAPGAIVLLSDGAQNRGVLQPLQAATRAKNAGIRIYTVAFGTAHGTVKYDNASSVPVPPDPETMQAIARVTGGQTFTAHSAQQAVGIYRHLGSTIGRTPERQEITSWLALGAALLLLTGVGVAAAGSSPALP